MDVSTYFKLHDQIPAHSKTGDTICQAMEISLATGCESLYGIHTVPIAEAFAAIHDHSDRYLICSAN